VFQSPTLMPWARVAVNVRLPLDLAHHPRAAGDAAAVRVLGQVGLAGFERHLPRELSGGMQMRVSIARALVVDPELLLMDEPFGALDEFTRQRLDADLLALWQRRRLTVVFVTHSIQEAVFLSTRVVVMGARRAVCWRIIRWTCLIRATTRSVCRPRSPSMRARCRLRRGCRRGAGIAA
jgi:NitT/TauT family transport system ATP-binding protein